MVSIGGITTTPVTAGPHPSAAHDYARNPMIVYWEMTQACALACRHCRAEAVTTPHPCQLSNAESRVLLRQIAAFGDPIPHLILTGGDPTRRTDLFEIIDEARNLGISVSITPSVTQELTFDKLARLKAHGIVSLGISLDGSEAIRHNAVRGVDGCFDWTMDALESARRLGLPVQVNTLVAQETVDDLPAVYELLKTKQVMRWSLFFLIEVGRGRTLQPISPDQGEELMRWVFDLSRIAPFQIKTTEAPSYRRVALTQMLAEGLTAADIKSTPVYRGFGIRDGHGIMFVSNQGDIYPSGFLPLAAGNIRKNHAVDVYRHSFLFSSMHSPEQFKGKCGKCEYRSLCGGSRARAFAWYGDPVASDPFCPYQPRVSADLF